METFRKKKYKLGLVLSGGGVKGFAHAGAIQSLEEHGLNASPLVPWRYKQSLPFAEISVKPAIIIK